MNAWRAHRSVTRTACNGRDFPNGWEVGLFRNPYYNLMSHVYMAHLPGKAREPFPGTAYWIPV